MNHDCIVRFVYCATSDFKSANIFLYLDCSMIKGNKQEKILRDWKKLWYVYSVSKFCLLFFLRSSLNT